MPNGDRAVVPRAKVVGYLLAPDHPDGKSKARFFLGQGYRPARPERLVDDLLGIARTGTVVETLWSPHGIKHIVDGTVETPDGSRVPLRTVWIVEPVKPRPRFVTAYPT